MTGPAYSVVFSAPLAAASGTISAGTCLVPDSSGAFLVATSANRGTKRSVGIATTAAMSGGTVDFQQVGLVTSAISGLGTGTASWVRVSTAGRLERCNLNSSDDICGWCETDGSCHLFFGIPLGNLSVAGDGFYNVQNYGAKGDGGTTDDTAAVQAAITACVNAGGGTVYFPPGVYKITSGLNIQSSLYVILQGAGGFGPGIGGWPTPNHAPSTILYTGGGSSAVLQMNSAFGSVIRDLGIVYNSASFTGILIDYSYVTEQAIYNVIERCLLGSAAYGAWNADALIDWTRADGNVVRDCHIQGAKVGVRFRKTRSDWSVNNTVEHCVFRDFQTSAIINPASAERIINNIFECNLHQGTANYIAPVLTFDIADVDPGSLDTWVTNLVFSDNWMGDGNDRAGAYRVDLAPSGTTITVYGLVFERNDAPSPGAFRFGDLRSATISKNRFRGAATIDGHGVLQFSATGTYTGVSIVDNIFMGGVVPMDNVPTTAFVKGNTCSFSTTPVGDQMTVLGPLTLSGALSGVTGITLAYAAATLIRPSGATIDTVGAACSIQGGAGGSAFSTGAGTGGIGQALGGTGGAGFGALPGGTGGIGFARGGTGGAGTAGALSGNGGVAQLLGGNAGASGGLGRGNGGGADVDAGTGTTNGYVTIGTANAAGVTIGRSGIVIALIAAQTTSTAASHKSIADTKGTAYDVAPMHVQTTDATVTTLHSFTLASNTAVSLSAMITGVKSDCSQAAAYTVTACFRNNAGTVAQVGSTTVSAIGEDDVAWDCSIDNSGTTIRLLVQGKAATTVQWTGVYTRLEVIP